MCEVDREKVSCPIVCKMMKQLGDNLDICAFMILSNGVSSAGLELRGHPILR